MSRVFVAEELRLKRKVVVKVLSPELAQGISVERFEREIQTVAALQHANIVPVHTAGDTNGLPFYTMPFVEGESLRSRLGRGPLAVTEVIGILRDVTRALAYAHQHGVVHRDIKPDNVLLSGGAAVVTDFGIAKAISASRTASGSATLTQIGTSIGTPAYMAPEQAAGDPDIDARADIYSLGAMAYELLTGQVVFADRTAQRMLAAHMSEAPTPITAFRPDLPASLADLIMSCLAKDAKDRPQTAGDIARVLETITSGSGMRAMPPVLLGGPGMFKKALAIYAVAFVAVAILAKAAIVGIGLPDWVFPGALIVMALGLPVVLWTGYVQRVTRRAMTMTPTFTPGGSPSTAAHGTMASMALKAAPKMSWYKTARSGMYVVGAFVVIIAAFMSMRALGLGPPGSLVASGKINAKDPLLLTDFRMVNADTSLGRVVSDAVRAGLGESNMLTVLPSAKVVEALRRMQQKDDARIDLPIARSLAAREGIKAIVDGDVTGVGTGYIVQLRLISADSGTEIASFRETGEGPRGLIDAADKLARALRGKAGESLRAVHATPALAEVTTASLEALRKYTGAYRATGESRYADAVKLAREAIALDTGFALAYRQLSESLINEGGTSAASDSAITRAYRFRARLGERERLAVTGDYFGRGPGRDRAKAIEAFQTQLEMGDYSNTNSLGVLLATRREFARADSLGFVRIRVEPERLLTYTYVTEWRLAQGKLAAAESVLALVAKRAPSYGNIASGRIGVAIARDSLERAIAIADSARRTSATDAEGNNWALYLADIASLQGRNEARSRLLRDAHLAIEPGVASPVLLMGMLRQAGIEAALAGPSDAMVRRVDAVVSGQSFVANARSTVRPVRHIPIIEVQPLLAAAATYAAAGSASKARQMLARFDAEVRDTVTLRMAEPERHGVLGYIALAEKRGRDAIAEFRKGDMAADGPASRCAACLPFQVAQAFELLGERDSTIAQLESFMHATTGLTQAFEAAIAPIENQLGELYEAKGDAALAAKHYRRFIDLWKSADPELQPRVAEARRRLVKLTPIEKPR